MQIHELTTGDRPKKKRIGRGGKRGTYSGRGNKGQKARSGGNVDPLFEGGRSSLVERLKKLRGFRSPHPKKTVVKLSSIEKHFQDGDTVSAETLEARGLVEKQAITHGIKILSGGTLTRKITVSGEILLSETARTAIEQAGGTVGKK